MSDAPVAVVHPTTGELLPELHTVPPESLCDALLAVKAAAEKLRHDRRALEDELRRRVHLRTGGQNRIVTFGDFEVTANLPRERVWDADALEATMRDLVDQGVLQARDCTDVIRHTTEVSRSNAARLLERLGGPARDAVRRCFTWKAMAGKGRVEVARSVALPTPEEMARR